MKYHFKIGDTFQNLFDIIKDKNGLEIDDGCAFAMKHGETKSTAVPWETLSSWANAEMFPLAVSIQLMGGGKGIRKDKDLDAKIRLAKPPRLTRLP